MKEELEKRIVEVRKELAEKNWQWERKGYEMEVEEMLAFLEKLYEALYKII